MVYLLCGNCHFCQVVLDGLERTDGTPELLPVGSVLDGRIDDRPGEPRELDGACNAPGRNQFFGSGHRIIARRIADYLSESLPEPGP